MADCNNERFAILKRNELMQKGTRKFNQANRFKIEWHCKFS